MAGCRKLLCHELNNTSVMERTGFLSLVSNTCDLEKLCQKKSQTKTKPISNTKKRRKKKTNKASIYIYAYQLMVGYSKSSKTLLCQSFPGRNQCLLQGSIV